MVAWEEAGLVVSKSANSHAHGVYCQSETRDKVKFHGQALYRLSRP